MTHVVYSIEYKRTGYDDPCFKIGLTSDINRRRRQHERHIDGLKGWQKTLSVKTIPVRPEHAGILEEIWTLMYIAAYGFRRVRGAQYDSPNMNGYEGQNVTFSSMSFGYKQWVRRAYQQVATCLQLCYRCHTPLHQKRQCYGKASNFHLDRFIHSGVPGYDSPPVLDLQLGVITDRKSVRLSGQERILKMLKWTMNDTHRSNRRRKRRSLCH